MTKSGQHITALILVFLLFCYLFSLDTPEDSLDMDILAAIIYISAGVLLILLSLLFFFISYRKQKIIVPVLYLLLSYLSISMIFFCTTSDFLLFIFSIYNFSFGGLMLFYFLRTKEAG
jgi:hypothetical protein